MHFVSNYQQNIILSKKKLGSLWIVTLNGNVLLTRLQGHNEQTNQSGRPYNSTIDTDSFGFSVVLSTAAVRRVILQYDPSHRGN